MGTWTGLAGKKDEQIADVSASEAHEKAGELARRKTKMTDAFALLLAAPGDE
jgi:hypothetical protein